VLSEPGVGSSNSTPSSPGRPPTLEELQGSAYQRLRDSSTVPAEFSFQSGFPRGVVGRFPTEGDSPVERATSFLEANADLYLQGDENLALEVLRVSGPDDQRVTFQQTYRGLPVYGGELVVNLDGDEVVGTVGGLLSAGVVLNVVPALAAEDAEQVAEQDRGLPAAGQLAPSALMVYDPALLDPVPSAPRLVWRVARGGNEPSILLVDAHTGEVVFRCALQEEHTDDFDIDLEDAEYTNAADTLCYDFPDSSEEIGSEEGVYDFAQGDAEAQDVWNTALQIWLFYHDTFGIHSYDDNGEPMDAYAHSNKSGTASYSSYCDLFQFTDGSITTDIFAHEFAHAVINESSDLIYANQSGALNESFADIMGARADGNWTVAEELGTFRSMSNPPAFGDPDHLSEYTSSCNPADNGCVHTNSGIQNKVAYLLGAGGTHPDTNVTVESIGMGPMASLAFAVMASLPSGAQIADARTYWVIVADVFMSDHTADGEVVIPPKPLTNGNCDPDVRVAGRGESSRKQASPTRSRSGLARTPWLLLPLPVCLPTQDSDPSGMDHSLLTLDGLDPGWGAWVVDNEGDVRAKRRGEGMFVSLLYPADGTNYFLKLFDPPDEANPSEPLYSESFTIRLDCGETDELLGPLSAPTEILIATPLPTPTPPAKPIATFLENARCRSGDGTAFPDVAFFNEGAVVPVEGRNRTSTWIRVLSPFGAGCWVFLDLVELNLPIDLLPILPSPATPTPSPTPCVTAAGRLCPTPTP